MPRAVGATARVPDRSPGAGTEGGPGEPAGAAGAPPTGDSRPHVGWGGRAVQPRVPGGGPGVEPPTGAGQAWHGPLRESLEPVRPPLVAGDRADLPPAATQVTA